MTNQPSKQDPEMKWGGLAAVGLEVGIGVAVGYVVGHWLDKHYGWESRGAVIGSMLGLAGGLYLLIKQAIRANKD
jgi:F0F1-type ATP synthase assembly protein I